MLLLAMVKQINVLLFGVGSIGAVYLHQLRQAGCIVTAVCRSNHCTIKENGFRLTSKRFGNVQYRLDNVIRSAAEYSPDCF
jgi:2-dehydropantoate 2-reductase